MYQIIIDRCGKLRNESLKQEVITLFTSENYYIGGHLTIKSKCQYLFNLWKRVEKASEGLSG